MYHKAINFSLSILGRICYLHKEAITTKESYYLQVYSHNNILSKY